MEDMRRQSPPTSIEKVRRKRKVADNVSNTTTWFVFVLMTVLDLFVFWVHLFIEHVVPCFDTCVDMFNLML